MKRRTGFFVLWSAMTLSIFGTELTEFAVGLWLLKEQESVLGYTVLYLAIELPAFCLYPLIGQLLDRFDKRRILIFTELLSATATLAILMIHQYSAINPMQVYAYMALTGIANVVRLDCFTSLTFRLVDGKALTRANALQHAGDALPQLLAPIIGAWLYSRWGLAEVFGVDIISYLVSMAAAALLLRLVILNIAATGSGVSTRLHWRALLPDYTSWRLIRASSLLSNLMSYSLCKTLLVSILMISLLPYFTHLYSVRLAGYMMSIAGGAMVLVSVLLVWRCQLLQSLSLPFLDLLLGISFMGMILSNHPILQGLGVALSLVCIKAGAIKLNELWQREVPEQQHGRVFAIKNSIMACSRFSAYLATGLAIETLLLAAPDESPLPGIASINLFYLGTLLCLCPLLFYYGRRLAIQWPGVSTPHRASRDPAPAAAARCPGRPADLPD